MKKEAKKEKPAPKAAAKDNKAAAQKILEAKKKIAE